MLYCDDCRKTYWPVTSQYQRKLAQCDCCRIEKSVHDSINWTTRDREQIAEIEKAASSDPITKLQHEVREIQQQLGIIGTMTKRWADLNEKRIAMRCERCKGGKNVGQIKLMDHLCHLCINCSSAWLWFAHEHPRMIEWMTKLDVLESQISANINAGETREGHYHTLISERNEVRRAISQVGRDWVNAPDEVPAIEGGE